MKLYRPLAASLLAALACPVLSPSPASAQEAAAHPAIRVSEYTYTDAPYPQSHASTIVETADGTIAAAWFGGTRERNPDVEIWFARRGAAGWEEARSVANGVQADGTRQPTWNPVLFQDPAGPLHLFYKVGPSPQTWWGMVVSSADGGETWGEPRRLPDGILGPIKNKPVVLPDGTWLSPSSTEAPGDVWRIHFERSSDGGQSWTRSPAVEPGPNFDAIQPSILFAPDGTLQAVGRSRQGVVVSTFSQDNGATWRPLIATDLPNPNSGTDAVTLKDGRQLIVYNHSAHSPEEKAKGTRYPLNVGLSDDGVHWRNVLVLAAEPISSGYAYPAVIQSRDGLVHITYTEGRRRIRHVVLDLAAL
ncbi:sialidase family protein (plasmid) [Croceibacterium sp. TMG7-5b_MA50]|uniref:sialidase family protein n=1 Tax=Croceibacterium sp. TMG7-5b_MA50 TaxID=3121290 RepID=UPI0032218E0B